MPQPKQRTPWPTKLASSFRPNGILHPTRLLHQDAQKFLSRWPSDWTTFTHLVLASAVYVFFTNLLPGITFASDLYQRTGQNWGTIEIVFGTGLCGIVFSLFSLQPLVILGITGPFTVLAENIYRLCAETFEVDFLQFMAWSLIHSGWMHVLLAVLNAHDWTMVYVTEFSCEIFSLLNSIIYFHKAVQELERAHAKLEMAAFLYAVIGAAGTFLLALFLSSAERWPPVVHRYFRMGVREYAAAISIVVFIGMPYVGELKGLDKDTLYTSSEAFRPTRPGRESFYVEFWRLPAIWVAAAMIPGFIITVLFFFDHEISSIICTIRRYGTRKPTGYAQDIVLLGLTTALCGILGIPPANGLLPQAPLHSESLLCDAPDESVEEAVIDKHGIEHIVQVPVKRVLEQRWSHFLHAAAILAFIAPPLQLVLGLTPTSVLAGLFLFMGQQSLSVNPILQRTIYALTPFSELPPLPEGVGSWWSVHAYTAFEIIMAVVIFIVTLTVAGPAFPLIIAGLVPFRLVVMWRIWSRGVLRYVDRWACREGCPEDERGDEAEQEVVERGADVEKGAGAGESAASTGVDVDVEMTKR